MPKANCDCMRCINGLAGCNYGRPENPSMNQIMEKIVADTKVMLFEFTTGDIHHRICSAIADEYHLWEDDSLPMWLMYVVSGVMRDEGVEN